MAFLGYLLKINGVIFPNKYIKFDSYNSSPNQVMDVDAYRDADGVLHRNTLDHTPSKIEFNTPYLNLADKMAMQSYFPNRITLTAEYWTDESNSYEVGTFYVPDITFEIYHITAIDITYKPIRIAFIEY
jgi:hypothetical protein